MSSKLVSKILFTSFATSFLCISSMGVQQATAANNLLQLFSRKPKVAPVAEVPVEVSVAVPVETKEASAPKNKIENKKRVATSAPKTSDYRPESLVTINFSSVDFLKTNSTGGKTIGIEPTLLRPFNVILERTGERNPVSIIDGLGVDFSKADVKAEKDVADALLNYYANNPHFIWSDNGNVSFKAQRILDFLSHADADGLEPEDYFVALPDNSLTGEAREQAFIQFDVTLSARILRYVTDASQGRVIANRLSGFHDLPRNPINLEQVIELLAKSDEPVGLMHSYQPQSDYYRLLRNALARLPKSHHRIEAKIPRGVVIKPGENNDNLPKVVALLLEFAPSSYLQKNRETLERFREGEAYTPELVNCIKDYQRSIGSSADGIIGAATLSALQDNDVDIKRQKITDSMERLRWLPHNFGDRYVFVNQAAYRAQYVENDEIKLDMKVVVGSPSKQTYFFYDKIRLVTFNPSWGVPRSIVLNEMLPKIMNDTSFLKRNNYELYNSAGKPVSAASINWQQVASSGRGLSIRQKPGRGNALGELKILFPNKHDIYLHDTPNKTAFSRDMRAVSHGCVRLENPREMAAAVLGKNVDQLKPYFGKSERSVTLDEQVPVFLTYFTAWPDLKSGEIQYYSDVYSRDRLMLRANEKINASRNQKI